MNASDTPDLNPEEQNARTPGGQTINFLVVTAFLKTMGAGVLSPVLPFIVQRYISNQHILATAVGWLVAVYALCQFVAAPGLGLLTSLAVGRYRALYGWFRAARALAGRLDLAGRGAAPTGDRAGRQSGDPIVRAYPWPGVWWCAVYPVWPCNAVLVGRSHRRPGHSRHRAFDSIAQSRTVQARHVSIVKGTTSSET